MSIVVLKLLDVKRVAASRPQGCPYCEGETFQRWLAGLVLRLGVSVIVNDDLASYRLVAERLQMGHQVC